MLQADNRCSFEFQIGVLAIMHGTAAQFVTRRWQFVEFAGGVNRWPTFPHAAQAQSEQGQPGMSDTGSAGHAVCIHPPAYLPGGVLLGAHQWA